MNIKMSNLKINECRNVQYEGFADKEAKIALLKEEIIY